MVIHFHVHNFFIHTMKFDRIKLNFRKREAFPYEYMFYLSLEDDDDDDVIDVFLMLFICVTAGFE